MYIHTNLERLYSQTDSPIAFLDESYEIRGERKFYILASALILPEHLRPTRSALLNFYGGAPMHAAPMFRRTELETLRGAIDLAASQHDGLDVIVVTELSESDDNGLYARQKCIKHIVSSLHRDEGVSLFVFDSLRSKHLERYDRITFHDLRHGERVARSVKEVHTQPSREPLLGLPDLIAWTFRQRLIGKDTSWFKPFEPAAQIHNI